MPEAYEATRQAALVPEETPAPAAARILAMLHVASTPAQAGQRLIAAVCAHWQRLRQATVLLDGSQSESAATPGLHQLLQDNPWRARARLHPMPVAAGQPATLPARHGLQHLAGAPGGAQQPLHTLQQRLPAGRIALLYADAALLAPLLGQQPQAAVAPLLLLDAPQSRSGAQCGPLPWPHLLEIYRYIKHLARCGVRHCLLAVPTLARPAAPLHTTRAAPDDGSFQHWEHSQTRQPAHAQDVLRHQAQIHALCQCARRHLGHACTVLPLRADASADDIHPDDLRQLAQHWLASAAAE